MSGGYASKRSMANGRASVPMPQPKIRSMTIGSGEAGRFNTRLKMNQKEKKMNFIKRKLRDWLFNDGDYAQEDIVVSHDETDISDHENSINFNVINASGGRIVQVRFYDRKTDRHSNKLHIITPDEDLATSLAHILAIETMSR